MSIFNYNSMTYRPNPLDTAKDLGIFFDFFGYGKLSLPKIHSFVIESN